LNQQAAKLNEEINLLYVTVTRTRNSLFIPENLLPLNFVGNHQIHKMRVAEIIEDIQKDYAEKSYQSMTLHKSYTGSDTNKAYSVEEIRLKYVDAFKPWTISLDDELTTMYCEGVSGKNTAKHFGRTGVQSTQG